MYTMSQIVTTNVTVFKTDLVSADFGKEQDQHVIFVISIKSGLVNLKRSKADHWSLEIVVA